MHRYKPLKVKNRDNFIKTKLLLFAVNFTINNLSV